MTEAAVEVKPLSVWLFIFGTFAPAAICQESASAKDAKIEKLLVSMNVDKQMEVVFNQIKSSMGSALPPEATDEQKAKFKEVQGKIFELLQSRLNWQKMRPQYVQLYSETFTNEEIDGLVKFYESPAGKAFLRKMPTLMSKSMAIGQQAVQDVLPEIERLTKEAAEAKQ